jgi:large subunit ribosomal protein L23
MEKKPMNLIDLLDLIKSPSLTEKSLSLYGNRQYTFLVDRSLQKGQIKFAIEKIFDVQVSNVRTSILPEKTKRVGKSIGKKAQYKKAFVKLKEGNRIKELSN